MDINWLAVLAAAITAFIVGGLWYGPVFGKAWMALTGISAEKAKSGNMAVTFGGAFVLSLIAAATFAMFLGKQPPVTAALYGLCAGACWVGASFGINDLFERRPLKLFAINAGYHTLQFTLIGLILGLWH